MINIQKGADKNRLKWENISIFKPGIYIPAIIWQKINKDSGRKTEFKIKFSVKIRDLHKTTGNFPLNFFEAGFQRPVDLLLTEEEDKSHCVLIPPGNKTSWWLRIAYVSKKHPTTLWWNIAKMFQWCVSTASYWNVVKTSQKDEYVFTTSQTSLKWNTQGRLSGMSPRRLSGRYPQCESYFIMISNW